MAGVLTRTIRRRKKATAVTESNDVVFPLRELPYEIQLMIGRECVLRPVPVIVGKTIARWRSDPAEELDAKTCHTMLHASKDFRKELYRMYYEENIFELGYYYDRGNFLHHPGRHLVHHVLVDALRALIQPVGVPSSIPESLSLLPALKCLSIRLRRSLLHETLQDPRLPNFMIKLCRILSLETIQLVIEYTDEHNENNDWAIDEYKKFIADSMTEKQVWPKGIPSSRKMPQFVVKWDHITAVGLSRYTLQKGGEQTKPGKIMTLVNSMRRSSVSSDTTTPNPPTSTSGRRVDSGYFIAST